ncbi:NAD(P)-dependent oxidoreductase [Methylocella sp. CPCC 101449]|uniref:NAD-dependent epimerase/dehydratase family protein n=1 Tax=Methylocella sp. CPCC 101449 TaxID=2987531 RepID=UPI00288DDACA|nr:NAD(P)-dependent oxidoreductase [Methylocella sp. CPCC 101449]MDT2021753.1 NAD(P)-dependent oxidoreductase [Methylocella sp. CPCC 101449]HEV2571842.1 NAD(P)-dependent oxidoreductase [Beijerinckiaceae bacterium]
MRILVTGASGFVGRHTIGHLAAAGHEVIAAGRLRSIEHPGIRWINDDLIQPAVAARIGAAVRPDILLHLAWTVEAGKFWTDPDNLDWVAASLSLARACAEKGTQRICMVGSCYEYQWPADGLCREATTPSGSHTLYDVAKDSVRRVLEKYAAEIGISVAWARLFNLYGPFEDPNRLVASVARALLAGRTTAVSSGKAIRDYMDIRDTGAALAALTTSDVSGIINIATGEGIRVADIVREIADIAGRPELVRFGALPDRDEPLRIVADVGRLRNELKCPAPTKSRRDNLADALSFWREHMASQAAGSAHLHEIA